MTTHNVGPNLSLIEWLSGLGVLPQPALFPTLGAQGDLEWIAHDVVVATPQSREAFIDFVRTTVEGICGGLTALGEFPEIRALVPELVDLLRACVATSREHSPGSALADPGGSGAAEDSNED